MIPQSMNVWYLSAHDQPRGQSSRTYDFSRELVRRGHRVTMFTNSYCHWTHVERLASDEKWRVEEIDGIRVVWLRTIPYTGNGVRRGLNMLSNAWRALGASRVLSDRPDVVIGPSVPLGTGWAASQIARKHRAAFVFEIRDVWPIALVDDGGLSKSSPVYYAFRALEKLMYRRADRISATMPFVFDHVEASGGTREHVTWIPNGVAFERFAGFEGYDGGASLPLVVMYVGGFGVAHDVITVVRTAQILEERGIDGFRFVFVGNGPKRQACERLAMEHQLSNVEFRDSVPKAEIPRLQMEADILVAAVTDSASYRFGLNLNKIFDYMASARPVVFSGSAPNDPVVESGAGFSVSPERPDAMADALCRFLGMRQMDRMAIGKRGRRYVENEFDMRVLGGRMEALLQHAVNDSRKGQVVRRQVFANDPRR